ncbi:patatin-like phospholipase family protein [Deinococcus yavapaiensis]|uniref:NTE family protein n=1 Tax=Deinococcus yavapaiensis KR-236 TaxID=694435 RepID=A0A318S9B7_9DEIO|nr:patatin-like phospholipase family protein [Deinococcus yavapaiensis]PYE55315.1 NTE family protein [Deinococcus yavapaiensis KR-236]
MTTLGLALGGGGARGLAHIGVLRVLETDGVRPGVIAGTSMGGLIGAFFAAGLSADAIENIASHVSWRSLLELRPGSGLLRGSAFEAMLAQHLPRTFEELSIPLIVTATDVLTGRLVYLYKGDLLSALRATSAYPGAVDPVHREGRLLADGGILNQVPVDAALFLGAAKVIAVDVTTPAPLDMPARRRFLLWRRAGEERPRSDASSGLSPIRALTRALDIMQAQLTDTRLSLYKPDLLLRPSLEGIELMSFRRVDTAIKAGEHEAFAHRDDLIALAGMPRRAPAMLPQEEGDA